MAVKKAPKKETPHEESSKDKAYVPPYLSPPTKPLLENLPPELLHHILSWLDLKDVLVVRRTCSLMASVGLDHYGDEVPLVHHRDKYRSLIEIAQRPTLSKRMRSLYYVCDRLEPQPSLAQWEDLEDLDEAPIPTADLEDLYKGCTGRRCIARKHAYERASLYLDPEPARAHQRQLEEDFDSYDALFEDQSAVERDRYDSHCLRKLFEGCPGLREVTAIAQRGSTRRLQASNTAFAKGKKLPREWFDWEFAGVRQSFRLAEAVAVTGTELESLTLNEMSHRLFDKYLDLDGSSTHLNAMFRPLERLRLAIQCWPNEPNCEYDDGAAHRALLEVVAADIALTFRQGVFRNLLAAAPNLRVLSLVFPKHDQQNFTQRKACVNLQEALGDLTLPHLYEFSLSQAVTTQPYLRNFLLRHKSTLRRLGLANLWLDSPDPDERWSDFITSIAGQLSSLYQVRLRGHFGKGGEVELDYPDPSSDELFDGDHEVIEHYILHGGAPLDYYAYGEDVMGAPREQQTGYVTPRVPRVNPEADDPVLRYGWEEADWRL